ncbi:MAG TPA: flagellar hook-basal body protein [Solirubrobacteraceae bacterium]|nr:flagellar hook-basal body protein [Solirubrobacteraceae bacterium]
MFEGMYAAASGMAAQQEQLDAIGNDLANASTTGYRTERVGFRDLLYNQIQQAGTETTVGAGAAANVIGFDQSQGSIQSTGDPLDLAIEGDGYFTVQQPGGGTALTRDGAFQVDAQGRLITAQGALLQPPITLPSGVSPSEVSIAPDGTVTGPRGAPLGRIGLVTVPAPEHLLAAGGSLFTTTTASGAARPLEGSTIHQGALEASNVDLGTEMTQLMSTQRAYQLASSAIQNEDQMLSIANQLVT